MANLNILNVTGPSGSSLTTTPYRSINSRRVPMLMWTETRPTPISFWVNPSECQWRIATRTSIEPIQGGAVHHEWDATGVGIQSPQKFDQPVVNFTFQSGNIIPNSQNDTGDISLDADSEAPGLSNFYDFLDILNQPNVTATGKPNYVIIQYVSSIFPSLTLFGHFTQEGVQWTDTADNPNQITGWGASFVVFSSTPSLFDGSAMKSTFRAAYFS